VSLLRRRRRAGSTPKASLPRRPNAGVLRRERRALVAAREVRMRDLGGLAVEMYRYGAWRSDLLEERCAELVGIDARLADIDALLGGVPADSARCRCGASLRAGAQFCSNCGRTVEEGGQGRAPDDTVLVPPPPGR
jgi:hypothetical protein